MITALFVSCAITLLLLALLPGLLNILRSRSHSGSLLAVQFLGSGGIAFCALLSVLLEQPAALDVALLFALLAALSALVMLRRSN